MPTYLLHSCGNRIRWALVIDGDETEVECQRTKGQVGKRIAVLHPGIVFRADDHIGKWSKRLDAAAD